MRPPATQDDDIRLLCVALERNASLTSIDLRMNDISADQEDLDKIEVRKRAGYYVAVRLSPAEKGNTLCGDLLDGATGDELELSKLVWETGFEN